MKTKIEEYTELLKKHDWYYDYSDDHSVYERGYRQRNKLHQLAEEIDRDYELYNQYAPTKIKSVEK